MEPIALIRWWCASQPGGEKHPREWDDAHTTAFFKGGGFAAGTRPASVGDEPPLAITEIYRDADGTPYRCTVCGDWICARRVMA